MAEVIIRYWVFNTNTSGIFQRVKLNSHEERADLHEDVTRDSTYSLYADDINSDYTDSASGERIYIPFCLH